MNGLIIGIIGACGAMIYALTMKGTHLLQQSPKNAKSLTVSGDPDELFKNIAERLTVMGYRINAIKVAAKCMVLDDNPGLMTFGFFYPVFIEYNNGNCNVTVGIKSKIPMIGPIAKKIQSKRQNSLMECIHSLS